MELLGLPLMVRLPQAQDETVVRILVGS